MLFRHFARPIVISFVFLSLIAACFAPRTAAADLSSLPAGSVIDLGDGHPWLWVGSTDQTGTKPGFGYIMAMYNYNDTVWGSDNQTPTDAIFTTSDPDALYSNLPATIGDMAKNTALASNTWQWDNCSTAGSCSNTTTSTSRLSFVSYKEWQGTTTSYSDEPSPGSVGNLFCQAWRGTPCLGSILDGAFNFPWTRSGYSSISSDAWYLLGDSGGSLDVSLVGSDGGSLPVAWLSSNLCTTGGAGTFASPYTLGACSSSAPKPGDIVSFNNARYVVLDDNYIDANGIPQNTFYVMSLSAVNYRPFDATGNSNLPDITNQDNLLYYLNSPDSGNFYANIDSSYKNWIVPTNYGLGDCAAANATDCNLATQNSTVKQLYVTNPSVYEWTSGANNLYAQARYGENFNGTDYYLLGNALLRNPLTSGQMTGLEAKGTPASIAANAPTAIYPSLNLKSALITCQGSGTFADPYYLGDGNCDNVVRPADPQVGTLESLKTGDIVEASKLVMKIGDYHEQLADKHLFISLDNTIDNSDPSVESITDISSLNLYNFSVDYCRALQETTSGGCQTNAFSPIPKTATLKRDVYIIGGSGTRANPYQILHADTITSDAAANLDVRFSGYLFYESTSAAQLDGLTFVRNLENNFAIYKRDLAPLPESATDSATVPYYFLVNYYTQNPKLGEMTLVP